MNTEIKLKEGATSPNNEPGGNVPSGFILKLFQMVNGAPDEVITWTLSGDAFIIGSDLHRLETETLPQYFRHNRFQSLVRQLNFYSFRKVNRERNVWIYKHNLFHRDRPDKLHLVRRRTCPGVDGRKQRFSRLSAQRLSNKFHDGSANNSDTEDDYLSSTEEDTSVGELMDTKRKRDAPMTVTMPVAKKARSMLLDGEENSLKMVEPDTPVVKKVAILPSCIDSLSLESEEPADDASTSRKYDRMEMMQQSLVVSEVASKLEEYVKKAMREKGLSRTRRGGSGVVTPPFGTLGRFTMNSSDLITYDDEYEVVDEGDSLGVVSETDDILSVEETTSRNNQLCENGIFVAPVTDVETVKRIRFEILRRASAQNEELVRACANVAAFFMLTAPNEDAEDCGPKIVELLLTSRQLECEFYFYRAALHPSLFLDSNVSQGSVSEMQLTALRHALVGGVDRSEALHEFKVFSVNLIYMLLGMNGRLAIEEPLSEEDYATLLRTAMSWSKSFGVGA